MSPEEQFAVIRSFKNFDKSGDGKIEQVEFKALLKDMGRTDVTDDQIKDLFSKYDTNSDGIIDWHEYLEMVLQIQEEQRNFGRQGTGGETATTTGYVEGTKHTYSFEERNTIARLFNNVLDGDEWVGERFPINPESDDLWHVMADGLVFIRILCIIDKEAVDMRAVNKGKNGVCNIFETRQNIQLGLAAAKGKIKMIGVDASVFLEKKPHMLLGLCWQVARLVATQKIDLKDCQELYRLLKDGEELSDLMKLPAEELLVRWINYHLRKAGQERQVTNLGKDLQDSFAIYHVLNQLDKKECPLTHINDENLTERATNLIKNSSAIGVPELVNAEDWNKGNARVNTVYVAEIFNTRHGLEELTKEEEAEFEKAGIVDDDIAGTREERQFRLWINSLEIEDVYINNLYEDVRDGQVLLKVIHKINPNVVEWNRVEKNPNNNFKKGINCQVAFDAAQALKIKLIGIGASDIQQGNKKLVLAIVWQLMKVHYLQIIGSKSEQDLINWANGCKGNESR